MPNTLFASQVPIPIGPTTAALRSDCSDSVTSAPIVTGFSKTIVDAQQLNQCESDTANAFAFGGTTYGIVEGLVLSDGGGTICDISPGSGSCFGSVQYAGGTKPLTDNARNHLWLTQGSTITAVATSLVPPVTDGIYLGSALVAGGAIVSFSTSGVCYVAGGIAMRSTADTGMPTDTPAANTRFITKTPAGDWFWDGSSYTRLLGPLAPNKDSLVAGEHAVVPLGCQVLLFDSLTVAEGATLTVYGKLRVM